MKRPRASARGPRTNSSTIGQNSARSQRPTGTGNPIFRRVRIGRGTWSASAARSTAFVRHPRSFTRAGRRLGLSQPAVSAHIRALELYFDATLFEVRQRRVHLLERRCAARMLRPSLPLAAAAGKGGGHDHQRDDRRRRDSGRQSQLAAGQPIEEVLADYPYLEFADILAALAFAAEAMQERELPLAQPA